MIELDAKESGGYVGRVHGHGTCRQVEIPRTLEPFKLVTLTLTHKLVIGRRYLEDTYRQ